MLTFIAPYCAAVRLLSSFIPKSETLDTTIKKIQAISMKAAAGNHQIMRLPIVSQRPGRDRQKFPVNGWLTLKSCHSDSKLRGKFASFANNRASKLPGNNFYLVVKITNDLI
jgi:predicted NAD-dependent protein-ADP-ribosyltransferase YbiA (DUF1768 family)